ncbi:hypothetical protein EIN_194510 [Entamoeba invadens IP1]|uniref:ribonuclease Z n=1 Tax=Entamoeba invadens IP1 TaxID=370355 RepID=A0A0A1U3H1_ENTIV|nr:hypothetical protein EIN_194510 [Entamoeba invadens IP1]ELP88702.1 hypothetical protein EIN_194510 [Entamoeba invadens IP1]|eukprot:XP_004255473.1 hypothetical protein EIN_194510 [Entamoeba invadens IP1]
MSEAAPIKSTAITITILGNGRSEISPSFIVTMEKSRFLFNIPEGVQRACMEYKLKLPRLSKIFLTSDDYSTWGGFPGAFMTYSETEFPSVPLHTSSTFVETLKNTNFFPPFDKFQNIFSEWTTESATWTDGYFKVNPVVLETKTKKTICYHIALPTFLGKFDAKKAAELKIPGPLRGKLMKGENVKLENGKLVTQNDVCGENYCPGHLLVLHLPTLSHLEAYIEKKFVGMVCAIVSIVSEEVKANERFKALIEEYSKINSKITTMYLLDRTYTIDPKSAVCETTYRTQLALHTSLGKILPINAPAQLRVKPVSDETISNSKRTITDTITNSLQIFTIYPKPSVIPIARETNFVDSCVESLNYQPGSVFQVMLLGTGGAVPGKTRNVSSSILRFADRVVMIDCGETAVYHAIESGIDPTKIDLLFLTHGHGDHLFGIFSLLKMKQGNLLIIGPQSMKTAVETICDKEQLGCRFVLNKIFAETDKNDEKSQEMRNEIEKMMGARIVSGKTNHLSENYAVKFEVGNQQIVFTGDTSQCEAISRLCQDADYVVHECNFEDGMEEEAIRRSHSTPQMVCENLKNCNNKVVILNHIGQRTSKFADIMKKEMPINAVYSFDGMVFDDNFKSVWQQYKEKLLSFFELNEIDESE